MEKHVTFKDLVMQVDKDHALTYLIENMFYYGHKEFAEIYEKGAKVFDVLRAMEPVKGDLELSVWHGLTDDHEIDYNVSGVGYNESIDDQYFYAIETMPWDEWLGMPVREDTLKELSPAQIVGYSIWEMTCFGWTEEEIQENISKT